MCIHRKEICSVCKCPIQDMIVLCPDAKNRIVLSNLAMRSNSKVITYSPENVRMITSIYPHEMPTVERNSSMCRNHYTIAPSMSGMSYEQYRMKADSWMKM